MQKSSCLNYLILILFLLAAVAYLIYRWVNFAEERDKIYLARPRKASSSSVKRPPRYGLFGSPCIDAEECGWPRVTRHAGGGRRRRTAVSRHSGDAIVRSIPFY